MSRIVAFVGIAIIAFFGIFALSSAFVAAGDDITVTNETWTPTAGSVTQLDDSGIHGAFYDANVTVRDENDTLVPPGGNYTWFESNGTIKALTGGALDGDANATITYGYQETTGEQRAFAGMLADLTDVIGPLLFLAAVIVMLFAVRGAL